MNLLGFIITLILLLALSSSYFLQQSLSSLEVKRAYKGYEVASRKAQNDLAKKMYIKARKKKESVSKNTYTAKPERKSEKLQKLEDLPECVVLNIAPLVDSGKEGQKDLYEYLCSLIKTLYSDSLLITGKEKNPERHFVDHLLASIQKEKPSSLPKVDLKDPMLQMVLYRMLKGQSNGYPSLLNYIAYTPGEGPKKICLQCCDQNILTALFNSKISEDLWSRKEEDLDFLEVDEEKLQQLFIQHQFIMNCPEVISLVSLQHKKTKPAKTVTIKGFDSTSKVQITRKAYF